VSVLDAALAYRRLGFAVLPLRPGQKRPHTKIIKATRREASWSLLGERRAPEDEIREWYQRDPEANLGIITGAASGGLVVADFDHQRPERLIQTPMVQNGARAACLPAVRGRPTKPPSLREAVPVANQPARTREPVSAGNESGRPKRAGSWWLR
jgi:Bifunctional DNA primase/polymerase, N-terminal